VAEDNRLSPPAVLARRMPSPHPEQTRDHSGPAGKQKITVGGNTDASPKFLGCLDSILLILREIVQDSISRYWQQS
jgi:hypothetical protein